MSWTTSSSEHWTKGLVMPGISWTREKPGAGCGEVPLLHPPLRLVHTSLLKQSPSVQINYQTMFALLQKLIG